MVANSPQDKTTDGDLQVQTVAAKAFGFGRESAEPVGVATFQDPVMHHYFLLFMWGVVGSLGEHQTLDKPLDEIDKKRAMATMLGKFGTAAPEQIVELVNLLDDTDDEPAQRIKLAGAAAAREWDWGANPTVVTRFGELMQDPDNFPREVTPTLKSTIMPSPDVGSDGASN